jgi:putative addiction module component (TIGR02574 family)
MLLPSARRGCTQSIRQIAVAVVCLPPYITVMQAAAELKQMTVREKIQLMEALWDDLCGAEEAIPVPDWHKAVLDERERQVAAGEAEFVDWDAAKERIAKRIR